MTWPHGCWNRGDGAYFFNVGGTAGTNTRSDQNPLRICGGSRTVTDAPASTAPPLSSHPDCRSDLHWMCPASDPPQCIRKTWVCDGFSPVNPRADCDNGADETTERCGSGSSSGGGGDYYNYSDDEGFDWASLCPQANAVSWSLSEWNQHGRLSFAPNSSSEVTHIKGQCPVGC